jgi:glutamine amidotransferase
VRVAIIDYNAGNIRSVEIALQNLGAEVVISRDPEVLNRADRLVFPGQGEASSAMASLRSNHLVDFIRTTQVPFLGICLGLQLLCDYSAENTTRTLGIFTSNVQKFTDPALKVPQVGWNRVQHQGDPLFAGIADNSFFYFLHSYYAQIGPHTIATADYGLAFSCAMHRDNYYAVQFHPEKSGDNGQRLFRNFLSL